MDILFLAKIEYYCKFSFRYAEGLDSSNVHTEWIAFVTYYDEHPVWFGGPTQVWARSTSSSMFIRLPEIKHRVAYCEHSVDFGSRIGVLVASILSN